MKIGWILSGNRDVAGARIQGWNIHERLKNKGYDSEILYFPKGFNKYLELTHSEIDQLISSGCEVLFIQKLYDNDNLRYLITSAKKDNIKIIYVCMDKINTFLADSADRIFVVSTYLKNLLSKENQKKSEIIFDGFEQDKTLFKKHTNLNKIKLAYVSNNVYDKFPKIRFLPPEVSLKIIGPPKKRVQKFHPDQKIFSETPFSFEYITWSLETINADILECDVGVLPYPDDLIETGAIQSKSANRLIYFMSLGLPVIASPTEEFKKIIIQGKNGFIAKTEDEWTDTIILLKNNPALRKKIGEQARKDVIDKYSLDMQVRLYEKVLHSF